ncbi:hypothetical protein GN244_ATG05813 [Phytophthora infestans]|uniref:Transmembrane protein n=1 Tax=Phytophthora infestans TaxID=4787 RepID=A0A833SWT1_PHYIN|nr:hypothetical protein GN244_ATG05813 [Phytophthora infestans]KAF4135860.1 hypothetical protein GN958_ATG14947 [Phytophthora infestans]KAI9997414.1 hypothetical protein PInf_001212 [Phytophthora infestans]
MVRLGLSDSMRSTASVEDTEPLHVASHRRPPRQPCAASTAAATGLSIQQQTESKTSSFALGWLLRALLGGVLAIILLSIGINVLKLAVRTSGISNVQTRAQFERLERSFELLGRDTTRLQATAGNFLQSCQKAQVAASTRTRMLQNMAKSRFNEQTKTQIEEHEQVMKEVMQYYAQQEQQVLEASDRLMKMNVTLPVHIAARKVPETWLQDEQKYDGDARDQLAGTMEGLLAKTLGQEGNYQRVSVESVSIQRTEKLERSSQQMRAEPSRSYAPFFFYIVVLCASATYLWNAVSDTRNKELPEDKWAWSPVPKVLIRLKALVGSVVVIDDLRTPDSKDDKAFPEHIELS